MKVGKLATNLFLTTNQLLKKSLSCLLHELQTWSLYTNIFAHIELIATYIAGARLLVRPVWPSRDGARQLHQPSRSRGELGMPPRPGRPRGYLPGAPDGPPSPPAPTDRLPPAPGHKFSAAMVDDVNLRPGGGGAFWPPPPVVFRG